MLATRWPGARELSVRVKIGPGQRGLGQSAGPALGWWQKEFGGLSFIPSPSQAENRGQDDMMMSKWEH